MKASVSQMHLAHSLSMVSRAVNPRSTLPVLANVLVATDEGRLRLSATNLELGISSWIGAKIEEEGSITVPARTFADLINTLPNDAVTLAVNIKTQTLTVRCGASVTDIKGIDAQEFPPMPVPDLQDGIEVDAVSFKEMIQQVAFAASTDEARPVLQGVMLTVQNGEITLAATDGYRISVRKAQLASVNSKPIAAIIPAKALTELARISTDGDNVISMGVPAGRGQVLFHMKDAELVSQLIEGNFPDYKVIIPRSSKTRTILSTAGFLKACKQAEIIARESNNVVRINLRAKEEGPGEVELTAQSEEVGSGEAKVDATIEGPNLVIAFNVRFLREVLDVVKSPNVILETNANNNPALLKPAGDDSFIHVIMPMHL